MIEFVSPAYFILIFLPFIARLIFKPDINSEKEDMAINIPFYKELAHLHLQGINQKTTIASTENSSNVFVALIRILAWISLIIAVMRPLYVGNEITIEREGRNLMIALDISGSMSQEDFMLRWKPVSRLQAALELTNDFLTKRQGDRIGLVIFGSTAETFIPLTYDIKTIQKMLKEVDIGLLAGKTAIGDAIGESIKSFENIKSESSVIILLSDGFSNSGTITCEQAAEIAKRHNVKIYTIGIGPKNIKMALPFSRVVNIPSEAYDEKTLKMIADKTGGEYFSAEGTESLKKVYELIDKIEKIENKDETTKFRPKKEIFYWPLSLSFILFAAVTLYKAKKA